MSVDNITIHPYQLLFGKKNEHDKFINTLPAIIRNNLISITIKQIDVYRLYKERRKYAAGNSQRCIIFCNGTANLTDNEITLEQSTKINGIENNFTQFLPPLGKESIFIDSPEGITLAEYFELENELYILFDVFEEYNENNINIFTYIMQEFERLVWKPKILENSWKYTKNKEKLIENFTERVKKQKQEFIVNNLRQIQTIEDDINTYRLSLKRCYDNLFSKRRQVEEDKKSIHNLIDKSIKDLDQIIKLEKVSDIQIIDNKFHIFTNDIYIYNSKGKRYYGGKYKIVFDIFTSDVRFFNLNNSRKGFWTAHDPHPHVNGEDGSPCLGNVTETIVELSSQAELYALVITFINFLESVNLEDPAGANIIRWDEVDEEGNIIKKGLDSDEDNEDDEYDEYEDLVECPECGEMVNTLYPVYLNIDEEGPFEETSVCLDCRDNLYYYDEEFDAYIRGE